MNDVLDDLRAAADYQIRMSGSASDYLLEAENEIKRLRAEVERLRAVLRQCACSCKALRESCPKLEMDGTCPHLSAQEALEGKL